MLKYRYALYCLLCLTIGCGSRPAVNAAGSGSPAPDADAPVEPKPIAPQGVHSFSVLDMLEIDRVGSPAVSPDGTQIAYTLRKTDLEGNRGLTDLYLQPLAGGEPTRLTEHPASDSSPRWSPDGARVYFLSSRSGSSQVWSVAAGTGAPTQVTDLPLDISSFQIAPDGAHIAVTMDVFIDCDTVACSRARLDQRAAKETSGVLFTKMFVRHWDQWKDGRRSHLFTLALGDDGVAAAAEPTDVTRGLDADVPSKPFGGASDYTFHPDGQALVFAARDAGREEPWSTNFDLYHAPVDGSAQPRVLTADNPAWDAHPVFSPDGETLAYTAMERAGFEADRFRVVTRSWPDGAAQVLTQPWDRSVSELTFSPDGARLLVTAWDLGRLSLFAVDAKSGAVSPLVTGGAISSPAQAGDRLVFLQNNLSAPNELWTASADGSGAEPLSHHNDALLAQAKRGDAEQFSFAGAGGDTVYAWVVKPVDFDPQVRYPVAFLIHGGPQGSFGDRFHHRWNPQAYAGAGYAVVMVDFHGSVGYGQAFTDAIRGDWGGKPLIDLQKGLAAALQKYPWMNGDRVCALGASYGGYMVNWIAGNWSKRFRCLVNHDGIFDNRMMYYATEELWFPEWEHGGPYYSNPAGYEKHNPANHVEAWETPMLVIHGALDHRVPLEQGLATFTALQRRGVSSQLLYFPDENHWVLQPANSVQWHRTVMSWLDAHLKN
ncbi:MAG: S9 family peptidase [Haliangiales bacterium]